MKLQLLLVLAAIWTVANILYSIVLLIKEFKATLNSMKILRITTLIVVFSPIFTYIILMVAKFLKQSNYMDAIGTADAWIGFAGSIIGGAITMLALHLTFKHESKLREQIVLMTSNHMFRVL